jgi:hypothetical protein
MAWTTPPTFSTNELFTPNTLNTYLRDNMVWLKTRPWTSAAISGTTTSTSFVAATASASLTSQTGGAVLITFNGYHSNTSASVSSAITFAIDGVLQGDATNGLLLFHTHSTANGNMSIRPVWITSSPPAIGAHTYEVYRKTASGTLTLTGTMYIVELF